MLLHFGFISGYIIANQNSEMWILACSVIFCASSVLKSRMDEGTSQVVFHNLENPKISIEFYACLPKEEASMKTGIFPENQKPLFLPTPMVNENLGELGNFREQPQVYP
jgi:hypothetical protein